MNTYTKRIGFLISDQHFIPHGGIGQFAKGFTEMCKRIGWKVDIILDKKPTNNFSEVIESLGANIVYSEDSLSYSDHTGTFAFSDTVNFEKIINFRKSILKAFETNVYDMLMCNTQEAMSAAYIYDLGKYIPVMFYTHLHSMIFREAQNFADVFLPSYHNFYNKHMEFDNIVIGTQSQKNIDELNMYGSKNCVLLRMPMSERGLLEPNMNKREGVLFIGRWEDGKNPEAFIRVIKESKLPARVLTNKNGAKKFESKFKEAGIADYIIKAGVIGQEKVDFIKGCKVHFNPSLRENYPFAFFECLGHMPCVVLTTQDWSDNFNEDLFEKTSLENASAIVKTQYGKMTPKAYYAGGALDYVKKLDEQTAQGWIDFMNNFKAKLSTSNAAKINNETTVRYDEFIVSLNRGHLAQEDIVSVLGNKHKFNVQYTDKYTYFSKDKNFVPNEDESSIGLFEGLE